jgi:predicted transcriptional regulator
MTALSLRLPESLHRQVRELAEREDVFINQFIATAVAEKMSALLTVEYLEARARRGSRAHFGAVLRRVPDGPPLPGDEWSSPKSPATKRNRPRRKKKG